MVQRQSAPLSLLIVAVLFMLGGVSSLVNVIVGLTQGQVSVDLGVLSLFIGIGLLGFNEGWRTWALVFLWISLIGLPLVALAFLFLDGPLNYIVFGQKWGEAPRAVGVGLAAVMFALALWAYWVLTRPDIRRLFRASAERQEEVEQPAEYSDRRLAWLRTGYWYVVAICFLLLLWLQSEWRSWQLRSEIDRLYQKEVTIKAIDAETLKPLRMVFHSGGRTMGQRWPQYTVISTGDESEMRFQWMDIGPVEVGVSAEGYQEQRLHLGEDSEDRIVVRLRR